MTGRILLVEDEPSLRMAIEDALRGRGYEVTSASDGIEGERLALREGFDLVVLDVMLPGRDGFQILRNLRADRLAIPVVLLTARGDEFDRVQGFESGADGYVVKPFSTDELCLRLAALLRRAEGGAPGVEGVGKLVRFGTATVDLAARTVVHCSNERHATLSTREVELLEYFLRHENKALARLEILVDVWDPDSDSTVRTVDQHILKLRKKLEPDPATPRHFVTVHGVGYRFTRSGSG